MSFRDLKKRGSAGKKDSSKKVSVEDFIADAETYAKGEDALVGHQGSQKVTMTQALKSAKSQLAKRTKVQDDKKADTNKPFRHATFTLSEEAIAQLNQLASESHLAKSHILRILIDELSQVSPEEKLSKLHQSQVP